ncbi:MAG: addiction module protein [Gammaproteobacteria bacterium]|nr:addiction module protein [Gammaproteobacteria bacterium]
MEALNISLSNLTFSQKLNLMEDLWDDLTRHEKALESPHWHEVGLWTKLMVQIIYLI